MGTGYEVHRLVVRAEDDLVDILNNLTSNTEVILREGTHTAATQILIPSGLTNVTIRGSEASVINITYSGDNPIAIQAPATDITFEGFEVVYNGTAGGQTPLFAPIGSGGAVIRRLAVRNIHCDFAAGAVTFVRWDGEDIDVYNLLISGCNVYGTNSKGLLRVQMAANRTLENVRVIGNSIDRDTPGGSQVFALYGASGATVEDVVASGNSFRNVQEPLWLDFNSGTCRNFVWSANILKYIDSGNAGCWIQGSVSNIDIDGNIFETSGANYCLTVVNGSQIHISDNLFLNSPGNGLVILSGVTDSTIDDNVVYNCVGDGIKCSGARNKLSGNIIVDADGYGMDISGNNCAVDGCYVYSNGTGAGDYGIYITGTECQLNGCYVFNSVDLGFAFGASQISVVGCYAVGCGAGGFASVAASQRLTFTGCVADGNTGNGFLIAERYSFAVGCHSRNNTGDGFSVTINAQSSMIGASYAYSNGGRGFTATADNSELYGCMARDNGSDGFSGSWDVVNVCYSYDDGDAGGECGFNLSGNDATVTGCQATGSYDHGFNLTGARMNVTGCHARSCGNASGDFGIHVTGTNCNLTGCYAYDNYDHNIYVNGAECSLNGCFSIDAGVTSAVATAKGIYIVGTFNCKVSSCYVDNPNAHGIHSTSPETVIDGCYVKDAGDDGILATGSNSKVSNSYVDNSADDGINVSGANSLVDGCYVLDAGNNGIVLNGNEINANGCYTSAAALWGINVIGNSCTVDGCHDDGSAGFILQGVDGNVTGCTSTDSTGQGFEVTSTGTRTKLGDCVAINSTATGFTIDVVDVHVTGCRSYFATSHGFTLGSSASRCHFTGCTEHDSGGNGFYASNVANANVTFEGCRSYSAGLSGIIVNGPNSQIIACYVHDAGLASTDYGIYVVSTATRTQVNGCFVVNSYDHGIYVTAASSSVKGCEVTNAGQSGPVATACGIVVSAADRVAVNNCRSYNSEDHGLSLVNSDYCQINDNYLEDNGDYGLVEDANCDYCLYDGNFSIGNVTGAKSLNGSFRKQGTNSW